MYYHTLILLPIFIVSSLAIRPLPKLQSFNFDPSCSHEQQEYIGKHMYEALKVVHAIIESRDKIWTHNAYPAFMDSRPSRASAAWRYMSVFDAIYEILAKPAIARVVSHRPTLKIHCGKPDVCKSNSAKHAASVHKGSLRELHICEPFFVYDKALTQGRQIRPNFEKFGCLRDKRFDWATAGVDVNNIEALHTLPVTTVIRQLAMFAPDPLDTFDFKRNVQDCFRGTSAAWHLAENNDMIAIANADNYAVFAVTNYMLTLCSSTAETAKLSSVPDEKGNNSPLTFDEQVALYDVVKGGNFGEILAQQLRDIKEELDLYLRLMVSLGKDVGPIAKQAVKDTLKTAFETARDRSILVQERIDYVADFLGSMTKEKLEICSKGLQVGAPMAII